MYSSGDPVNPVPTPQDMVKGLNLFEPTEDKTEPLTWATPKVQQQDDEDSDVPPADIIKDVKFFEPTHEDNNTIPLTWKPVKQSIGEIETIYKNDRSKVHEQLESSPFASSAAKKMQSIVSVTPITPAQPTTKTPATDGEPGELEHKADEQYQQELQRFTSKVKQYDGNGKYVYGDIIELPENDTYRKKRIKDLKRIDPSNGWDGKYVQLDKDDEGEYFWREVNNPTREGDPVRTLDVKNQEPVDVVGYKIDPAKVSQWYDKADPSLKKFIELSETHDDKSFEGKKIPNDVKNFLYRNSDIAHALSEILKEDSGANELMNFREGRPQLLERALKRAYGLKDDGSLPVNENDFSNINNAFTKLNTYGKEGNEIIGQLQNVGTQLRAISESNLRKAGFGPYLDQQQELQEKIMSHAATKDIGTWNALMAKKNPTEEERKIIEQLKEEYPNGIENSPTFQDRQALIEKYNSLTDRIHEALAEVSTKVAKPLLDKQTALMLQYKQLKSDADKQLSFLKGDDIQRKIAIFNKLSNVERLESEIGKAFPFMVASDMKQQAADKKGSDAFSILKNFFSGSINLLGNIAQSGADLMEYSPAMFIPGLPVKMNTSAIKSYADEFTGDVGINMITPNRNTTEGSFSKRTWNDIKNVLDLSANAAPYTVGAIAATMATGGGELPELLYSTFATMPDYKKKGLIAGMNEGEAGIYGLLSGLVQGAVETYSPADRLIATKGALSKAEIRSLAKELSSGKNVMPRLKQFTSELLSLSPHVGEQVENIMGGVGDALATNLFNAITGTRMETNSMSGFDRDQIASTLMITGALRLGTATSALKRSSATTALLSESQHNFHSVFSAIEQEESRLREVGDDRQLQNLQNLKDFIIDFNNTKFPSGLNEAQKIGIFDAQQKINQLKHERSDLSEDMKPLSDQEIAKQESIIKKIASSPEEGEKHLAEAKNELTTSLRDMGYFDDQAPVEATNKPDEAKATEPAQDVNPEDNPFLKRQAARRNTGNIKNVIKVLSRGMEKLTGNAVQIHFEDYDKRLKELIESGSMPADIGKLAEGAQGFVDSETGHVYINPKFATTEAPIHEFGHLWNSVAKNLRGDLYNVGLNLIRNSPYYQQVANDPNYKHLTTEERIAEEALALAIGDKGARIIDDTLGGKFQEWMRRLGEFFKTAFQINTKDIWNMSLEDFVLGANKELFTGKNVFGAFKGSPPSVEETTPEMQTEDAAYDFFFKSLDDIDVFNSKDPKEAKDFVDEVFSTVQTKEDAKRAYRKLSLKYHPDRQGSEEIMKHINQAYEDYNNGKIRPKSADSSASSSAGSTKSTYESWAEDFRRRQEEQSKMYEEYRRKKAAEQAEYDARKRKEQAEYEERKRKEQAESEERKRKEQAESDARQQYGRYSDIGKGGRFSDIHNEEKPNAKVDSYKKFQQAKAEAYRVHQEEKRAAFNEMNSKLEKAREKHFKETYRMSRAQAQSSMNDLIKEKERLEKEFAAKVEVSKNKFHAAYTKAEKDYHGSFGHQFLFAGEKGAQKLGADITRNLAVAKTMDNADLPKVKVNVGGEETNLDKFEQIRLATGWFKDEKDGKWRYELPGEINPNFSKIELGVHKLTDILGKDNILFKAYPDLAKTKLDFNAGRTLGSYSPMNNTIVMSALAPELRQTLVHEIQHAIQDSEGLAIGTSPDTVFHAMALAGQSFKNRIQSLDTRIRVWEMLATPGPVRDRVLAQMKGLRNKAQEAFDTWVSNSVPDGKIDNITAYQRTSGEIEARNAELRDDLQEMKSPLNPELSMRLEDPRLFDDVDTHHAITLYNSQFNPEKFGEGEEFDDNTNFFQFKLPSSIKHTDLIDIGEEVKKNRNLTDQQLTAMINQAYPDLKSHPDIVEGLINWGRMQNQSKTSGTANPSSVQPLDKAEVSAEPISKSRIKRIYAWATDMLKKYFTTSAGKPMEIVQAKESAHGKFQYQVMAAERQAKRTLRIANAINFGDWDTFSNALKGDQAAFTQLPDPMKSQVETMRNMVDGLSRNLVINGYISPSQMHTVYNNMGEYLTRAYRIYEQDTWANKVMNKKEFAQIRDDAAYFFAKKKFNELIKQGVPRDLAVEQSNQFGRAEVLRYLDKERNAFNARSTEGKRNINTLKQRDDIPEPLRKLMGEYDSPVIAFMNTMFRLAGLESNSQMLANLRRNGLGAVFFEETDPSRPDTAHVKIATDGSEVWSPLNGLYTTPEMKSALQDIDQQVDQGMKKWIQLVGAVRWGKTVGSISTQSKNFWSNAGFAIMNGHWKAGLAKDAIDYSWNEIVRPFFGGQKSENIEKRFKEMAELGLLDQGFETRNMKRIFGDKGLMKFNEEMYYLATGKRKSLWDGMMEYGFAKPVKFLNNSYKVADEFWKIYAFMNEGTSYAKAVYDKSYDQLSDDERTAVNKQAAEIVKNTYPTYDRAYGVTKAISSHMPIFGNFLSFQAESVRVMIGAYRQAWNELKDPKTRIIGARRMAGFMSYLFLRTALNYLAVRGAEVGLDGIIGLFYNDPDREEKKDDINRAVPSFAKTSDKWVVDHGDGSMTVYDISSADPYNVVFKALNAATQKNVDGENNSLANAAVELFKPLLEPEMTFQAIDELRNNKDSYDNTIYSENDDIGDKLGSMMGYVWNKLKPGTLVSADRFAVTDDPTREFIAQFFGVRGYDINTSMVFSRKLKEAERRMTDDYQSFKQVWFNEDKDQDEKDDALDKLKDRFNKEMLRLHEDYSAFTRLGADPKVLDEILKRKITNFKAGWSPEAIKVIKSGEESDKIVKPKKVTTNN
jgi:hypothetical protein